MKKDELDALWLAIENWHSMTPEEKDNQLSMTDYIWKCARKYKPAPALAKPAQPAQNPVARVSFTKKYAGDYDSESGGFWYEEKVVVLLDKDLPVKTELYATPQPAPDVRDLVEALRHLYHNAYKSGAEMGLALDVAKDALTKYGVQS